MSIGELTAIISAVVAVMGLLWGIYVWFIQKSSSADLSISSLADHGRLNAVHGVDPIYDKEYQAAIYPEGARAAFVVVHNQEGHAPVTLTDISLEVERISGQNSKFSQWLIDATERPPAGLGKADVFKVTIAGEQVETAYWNKKSLDKNNLFQTSDGSEDFRMDFLPNKPSKELVFDIRVVETGLYRIRFVFTYFTGRRSITKKSEDIMIYIE
jgi:hypothetical protein